MPATRVHIDQPHDVYVGRPSKWGNPYSHMKNSTAPFPVDTREEAVACYRAYLLENLNLLWQVKNELKDKILACHCYIGLTCHADVLIEIINSDEILSLDNNLIYKLTKNKEYDIHSWFNYRGEPHCELGPAYIINYKTNSKYTGKSFLEWSVHGRTHREDGPAIEWGDSGLEWYYNDKKIDVENQKDFERWKKLKVFT